MKKFQINIFCSILTLSLCGATLARPKEFRKLVRSGSELVPNENKMMPGGGEPTCDELRAMWRFSRRQSRAAEITNEIPTYKDPFAYNVWEHYPKVRSVLGGVRPPPRPWSRPVYGRIVQHAPSNHPRVLAPESRAYDEVLRYLEAGKTDDEPRRRQQASTYRLSGGQAQGNRLSRDGSFQHLKELIWAERAKELHQQRLLEEAAAKTAAEKSAQQYNDNGKNQRNNYKYMDQEAKAARLRLLNGETDLDAGYVPDVYIRPFRQRSTFNNGDYLSAVSMLQLKIQKSSEENYYSDEEEISDKSLSDSIAKLKSITIGRNNKNSRIKKQIVKNRPYRLNVTQRYRKSNRSCRLKSDSQKIIKRKNMEKLSLKDNITEKPKESSKKKGKRCHLGGKAKGKPPEEEDHGNEDKLDSDDESDNCCSGRISLGLFQKFRDESGASTSYQWEEDFKNPFFMHSNEEISDKTSEEKELLELQRWGMTAFVSSFNQENKKLNRIDSRHPDIF